MAAIHVMERYGLLGRGRKVLDFGSSNLYTATADEIAAFVKRHNPKPRGDLVAWASRLAAGSLPDASGKESESDRRRFRRDAVAGQVFPGR